MKGKKYLPLLTVQVNQRNLATRVSIIYGENDSGKTTISKVFSKIKGVDEDINLASLLDAEGNRVDIKNDVDNIFVFNEDYINNNLKIKQDGLSTIVILGAQNDVDKEIKKIKKENLTPVIDKIDSLEKEKSIYEDRLNSNSPEYYLSKMKSKLQGDENWAGRQRFIKGNRRNESVSDNRYKDFIDLSPKVSRDKLIERFHDLKIELEKIRDSKSNNKLPTLNLNNYVSSIRENIEKLNELLRQEINYPKLSEFDRELIETIKNSPRINLNRTKQILKNTEINFCPTCLQEIDDSYRKKILKFIEQFLNRDVEQYKTKLEESIIGKTDIDFIIFSDIQGLDKLRRTKGKLDNIIDETNQQIQVKIDNPYTSIVINNKFFTILQDFEECIKSFDARIIEYNKSIPDIPSILEEMSQINNEIAYYDIINDYRLMGEAQKKKEKYKYSPGCN
ncbi:MAG: AAA family ATPase [Lactobacillus sp.]|nr:AAA family ATPase [Lactobacillus sp.]